jgi:hypothetical protein
VRHWRTVEKLLNDIANRLGAANFPNWIFAPASDTSRVIPANTPRSSPKLTKTPALLEALLLRRRSIIVGPGWMFDQQNQFHPMAAGVPQAILQF